MCEILFTSATNLQGDNSNLAVLSETKALRPDGVNKTVDLISIQRACTSNTPLLTSDAWKFPISLNELREIGRQSTAVNHLGVDTKRIMSTYWGSFINSDTDLITVQKHYSRQSIKLSQRSVICEL